MAYAMTKQGSLDNCVTYEFICDTVEDMNAIENRYRTIGSIAIVLQGASGLEVYISGSDKQWNSLSSIGSSSSDTAGLSIYICAQDEVSNGVPDVDTPDEATIYLVPAADSSSGNLYDEYIYANDDWEKFGSGSTIDLSGYYQKPVAGIPASDLADGVIPDVSGFAPKASPVFTGSISMGRTTNSTVGTNSVAVGWDNTASGNQSHAEGYSTKASGQSSHAEGMGGSYTRNNVTYTSEALGAADHIEGFQTRTASNQPGNHAEGFQTAALGGAAHAEGYWTIASGGYSHAEGSDTTASNTATHAEGNLTIASYHAAHAEGHTTTASGTAAHAEGQNTTASGDISHAEGFGTVASGALSHAEGHGTVANLVAMHAGGQYNEFYPNWIENTNYNVGDLVVYNDLLYKCKTANSDTAFNSNKWEYAKQYLVVIGNGVTDNTRSNAYALNQDGNGYFAGDVYVGCNTDSTGGNKVATTASPIFTGSISLGRKDNTTVGILSVASGENVTASGVSSHAEGSYTTASGVFSHAEGATTSATNLYSHAEGNATTASGISAHSEGTGTRAVGNNSHAEGIDTTAKGEFSHAEGTSTIANGSRSHVAGQLNVEDSFNNWNEWTANTSYSVGDKVKRTDGTTVIGYICKTANSDSTFTSSKWTNRNGVMNYAEIIGNGTDDNNRSNARVLDWDGNERLMGDIYVGCNADSTGGTKLPRIPEAPSNDGSYILQTTVTNGTPTYTWVSLASLSGVTF